MTPPAECKWGAHHKKTEPDLNFAFQPAFGFLAPLGIGKLRAQKSCCTGGLWWALVGSGGSGGLWGALVGSNTPKKFSPAAQKRSISAWNRTFRPKFALIPPKKSSPAAQKRSTSAWNRTFRPKFALIPPKRNFACALAGSGGLWWALGGSGGLWGALGAPKHSSRIPV